MVVSLPDSGPEVNHELDPEVDLLLGMSWIVALSEKLVPVSFDDPEIRCALNEIGVDLVVTHYEPQGRPPDILSVKLYRKQQQESSVYIPAETVIALRGRGYCPSSASGTTKNFYIPGGQKSAQIANLTVIHSPDEEILFRGMLNNASWRKLAEIYERSRRAGLLHLTALQSAIEAVGLLILNDSREIGIVHLVDTTSQPNGFFIPPNLVIDIKTGQIFDLEQDFQPPTMGRQTYHTLSELLR